MLTTGTVLQIISLVFMAISNFYVLIVDCTWFTVLVRVCTFFQWTSWNTLFLIMHIEARGTTFWKRNGASFFPQFMRCCAYSLDFWGKKSKHEKICLFLTVHEFDSQRAVSRRLAIFCDQKEKWKLRCLLASKRKPLQVE